jgi:hypothetical protein
MTTKAASHVPRPINLTNNPTVTICDSIGERARKIFTLLYDRKVITSCKGFCRMQFLSDADQNATEDTIDSNRLTFLLHVET